MKKSRRTPAIIASSILAATVLVACASGEATPSAAEGPTSDTTDGAQTEPDPDAPPYYEGKNVEIWVPTSPGGANDAVAYYLAEVFAKHVEGSPSVQVINDDTAEGIPLLNRFSREADRDGTKFAIYGASPIGSWAFGQEGVMYDPRQLDPIVGVGTTHTSYIRADAGIESPCDFLEPHEPIALGQTAPTGGPTVMHLLGMDALGFMNDNIDVVLGYGGGGDTRTAFLQGEIDLNTQSVPGFLGHVRGWIEDGEAIALYQNGIVTGDGIVPFAGLEDIPTSYDVYVECHGEEPSGEKWEIFRSLVGALPFNPAVTHADAPEEARSALIAGIERALEDPAMQQMAQDAWGDEPVMYGSDWDGVREAWQSIDESTGQWIQNYMKEMYDIDF